MSQETLRQQMAKLRGKISRVSPTQPKTMTRSLHKVRPRVVMTGDAETDAAALEAASPKPKQPWTERAKGKVGIATREANAIGIMNSVKSESLTKALDNIEAEINMIRKKSVFEAQSATSRELTAVRRDSETVLNLVKTIREGNRVNDVEVGHLPGLSKQMRTHLNKLRDSLTALSAPKIERHVPEGELLNEQSVANFRTRYKRQLDTALLEHQDKPFFFINQPVLPVFDGIVKSSALLAGGLPVEDMAGYPVLVNQKLLVVVNSVVAKRKIENKEAYVDKIIEKLNEQSKQNFVMAHEVGQAVVKDGVTYYWLMPNDSYKIMCVTGGANASIRQWGLAF